MRADASIVLGLAVGLLALDEVFELVEVEGDEAVVRAVFGARVRPATRRRGDAS